ncbi:helicase HerA domain-containing protein [Pyrobaculum sp.]|jgi:hypothetical protein|uniref:helicase HerA domain-containing protein n=1 Tax=Pyrobaculum sp. TaxID=2004705 RepID=UPI003D0B0FFA
MKFYSRVLLYFAGGLFFVALLAPQWPPAALLLLPLVYLHGEDLLVWLYSRFAPIEPVRVRHPDDERCAYDPRRGLYHWLWRVEPNRSLFGVESAEAVHEFYNKLSLQRGEWLTFVVIGDEKFIRFTSRRFDPARVSQVEAVLQEFYVATREGAWVGWGRPVDRRVYATAFFWLFYSAFAGPWALAVVLPVWLWVVRRFARGYLEVPLMVRFTHRSVAESWPASRQVLELLSGPDARVYANMPRWAVAVADRPPLEVVKKFQRIYEGRDTGKRLVRLGELAPVLERISQHNERPVLLYPFGTADVHTQNVSHDLLAQAELWRLRDGVKALTGDLMRFPIFYGGQLLGRGRYVTLAYDRFGRPVAVPIDSLPNAHGVIIGPSGMGKSWTVGSWLNALVRSGVVITVVDPHGDFRRWAKLNGAVVVEVPRQLPADFAEVLAASLDFQRVARAYGFEVAGAESARSAVERVASLVGAAPQYIQWDGSSHTVFVLRSIREAYDVAAFFTAALMLYLFRKFKAPEEEPPEMLRRIIVIDEARLVGDPRNPASGELVRALLELVQGGRKEGYAAWFIIQLETQLERDLLRSASLVLVLGGTSRAIRGAAEILGLSQSDLAYLTSALTPYEASLGGRPYATGVLLLAPREIKYQVKIPLDPELKPRRK